MTKQGMQWLSHPHSNNGMSPKILMQAKTTNIPKKALGCIFTNDIPL